MQRTVTSPANLSEMALADLKQWLGISRANEDAQLITLLEASLALCEAFIGQPPIQQEVQETLASTSGWLELNTRPVRSLTSLEALAQDGSRNAVAAEDYSLSINAHGMACIDVPGTQASAMFVVTIRAGLSADWAALPSPLKQGIIRLAEFHYRDRETGRDANPPASVTALWRPWRDVRLT